MRASNGFLASCFRQYSSNTNFTRIDFFELIKADVEANFFVI